MTVYYRKNFSSGVMQLPLKASPDYADDPRYDEIAVDEDHTLPNADDVDLTGQFRLVIWGGGYANPGNDPDMEIVTATRTTHPTVYQIVTRGEENTSIVAHATGCNVGLHYTAGVSNADLELILVILEANPGSIIYSWEDVWGNKSIGLLLPGQYGKVLVTAGEGQRPFWDWVWQAPGAAYGRIKYFNPVMYSGHAAVEISMNRLKSIEAAASGVRGTNLGPNADKFEHFDLEIPDSFVNGSMLVDIIIDELNFTGNSISEGLASEEAVIGSSYGYDIV